jgi:hypothetical protein
VSECKTLVGPRQSVIANAILKLKDDATVKKSSSILSEVSWRINKILTPETIKTIDLKEIEKMFKKTAIRYIESVKHERDSYETNMKVRKLENKAIGGGWC